MIIRSMNNEKEFPEGKTVKECLQALGAFPRGTLAAQSGGVNAASLYAMGSQPAPQAAPQAGGQGL